MISPSLLRYKRRLRSNGTAGGARRGHGRIDRGRPDDGRVGAKDDGALQKGDGSGQSTRAETELRGVTLGVVACDRIASGQRGEKDPHARIEGPPLGKGQRRDPLHMGVGASGVVIPDRRDPPIQ